MFFASKMVKLPDSLYLSLKVNYVADSKLSTLTNLLWLIICICCSSFAIYLVTESYTMWQKEPVITTLKSVGKPVTEIAFPTVTICSPGLFVENVKVALEKSFNQWRFKEGRSWEESEIPTLMAEFMEEKFQIKDGNVNIMDILNTMISPKDVKSTVAANGVRENFQACSAIKNRRKRSSGKKDYNLSKVLIRLAMVVYDKYQLRSRKYMFRPFWILSSW